MNPLSIFAVAGAVGYGLGHVLYRGAPANATAKVGLSQCCQAKEQAAYFAQLKAQKAKDAQLKAQAYKANASATRQIGVRGNANAQYYPQYQEPYYPQYQQPYYCQYQQPYYCPYEGYGEGYAAYGSYGGYEGSNSQGYEFATQPGRSF